MFFNAKLDKRFWAEAVSYATFLVNRLPCSGVEYKTPMEVWTGTHASYDDIQIFGYQAYFHVRNEKIDPRARKAIFLGFCDEVKCYKQWCLQDKKTMISRDVTFDKASMLKAPLPANGGSRIPVEKENKTSDIVVEMEITTPVNTQVTDSIEESNEDETTPAKGQRFRRQNRVNKK